MKLDYRLGATYLGNGRCRFVVWAPFAQTMEVHILSPRERVVPLERYDRGYHQAHIEDVAPGSRYLYRLDGKKERSDPASRSQPDGVHGPSAVIDSHFPWDDENWSGLPLQDYIVYELHVGTFTDEGTFAAVIPYLDNLVELGITAIELMPVAQFPGGRNWGYDGVYPFAVQNSYGGPDGLKHLVNACHRKGLAVVLDAVYNHLGPEGDHLADFGPYFTDRYKTPWGAALNFDGPSSDEVRRFFIENALYWLSDFHIDALRLDALHAIHDISARPFIEELATSVGEQTASWNREVHLIGESSANDARLVRPREQGGYGLDAVWNDEFHHSLHVLLTSEHTGYYQDFGQLRHLAKAFKEGFVYSGEYSAYRQRRHGVSSADIPARRFIVFIQNHDQVGNRAGSERLSRLVSLEALKLAAGVVILSPFVPLLFMGEEYGETAPFLYFVSHSEPELIEAVRQGRKEEFDDFQWQGELPDPQDEATFLSAKLNHDLCYEGHHRILLEFYKNLIRLRKEIPALANLSKETLEVLDYEEQQVLFVRRLNGGSEVVTAFNFNTERATATLPVPAGQWYKLLDSADKLWEGNGSTGPEKFHSEGEYALILDAKALLLYRKDN
ncbi:malto-oligosyltrehalose trehalohydrolase [Chloroflexota bacterium]